MGGMRWWLLPAVVCAVSSCTCDPEPMPDGGPGAEALAWPAGAQLVVSRTTADSAELQWPVALGPVASYRFSDGTSSRETNATTESLTGLRVGEHHAVSVVAVAADGSTTPPLTAEVAAAEPLAVTDGDISTDFCGANAFLVRGVDIPCDEMAVLTGHVRTKDGVGVPGLRVTVLKHPEWGSTTTQADGLYAIAVSTGRHTIDLRAASFLPLQRQVTAPPHLFSIVPDTVVLRRDGAVTTIATATGGFHRATTQEDGDGKRSTAVFVPAGTTAALKLPDGGTQPTMTLTLRATEATVGATGPEQMPATLPAATAYTFAADVTADEALAIGATGVSFGNPVALYSENFLRYPIGSAVPLGVYDDTTGRWESGPNAAVLTVTEGGGVDYTGDGTADADFPLLAGEKEALAANYSPGAEIIRSITTHFSAFDTNPCWACNGSCEENGTSIAGDEPQCDTCPGSVLRMQNQTLSEFFPVSGTGLALGWHSNRFNVRSAGVNLALGLLADGGQPEGVRGTFFRLDVAGRTIVVENLDGGIGDATRLAWDGKDVFGRTVQGPVPARASTGYGFGAVSVAAVAGGGGGGATGVISYGTPSFGVWPPPGARAMASTREAVYFLRHFSHSLGDWVPRENLGNLTLSVVHGYSEDGTLHLGTGGIVTAGEGGALLRYVAGGGTDTSEDAGFSTVSLSAAPVFADAPEGLYFIERESRVRLLKADGGVVTVAGSASMGFAGDGAPAAQGRFNYARLLEVDPQSNVFVGDIENLRIRRIDSATGLLSTYVGSGLRGSSPDGTLATEARLDGLADLLFGHDGHLYFMATDGQSGNLLRRVENGRVYTVAGGNCTASRPPWEARNPREVCFRGAPHWLGQDRDGRLYVAGLGSGDGTSDLVVRRIEADGSVRRLAGAGPSRNAEEPVARNACFSGLTGMTVGDDGTVYVGESGGTGCGLRGPGLRAISPEGDLSLFVGGVRAAVSGAKPPDGSAYATQLNGIGDVTRRPNGTLLFLHRGPTPTLHEVVLPGPRVRRLVPSRDGNEVYGFDARGRHLRTTSARTGVTLWEFSWGPNGLDAVKDVNGDVTTVERDASGRARALIATDGQRTELTLDATGRVSMLKDSEGRFVEAAYKEGTSLLSEWKDQNGNPTRFEWDGAGNLVAHINALGARKQWERRGNDVVFTSPLGKVTTYGREVFSDGALLTTTFPDGTKTVRGYSGAFRRMQSPDGTTTSVLMQSGTRFGRAVDVPGEITVRTPSGLESRLVATRTTTTAPNDPLSIREEVEELRINGRLWRSRFDGTARTYELVSPMGRRVSMTLDEKSRPLTVTALGVLPVTYAYDARGRVTSVTQGARSLSYAYAPEGYLASVRNALNQNTQFEADSTGQVSKVTQADAKDITMLHDALGNLTSVTPADRTAHTFGYSKVNEVTSYQPPQLPGVMPETTSFDLDGLVSKTGHADGSETSITRDAAGRATQVKTPWWTNDITYDVTTGQVNSLTRGSNRLEYKYDGLLVTEEKATGLVSATSRWTHDSDFRVVAHTIDGVSITSTYDADGRLTQRGPVMLTYDVVTGYLATLAIGAVVTSYMWNEYGQVSSINSSANGIQIYSESIQYDVAGRVTQINEVIEGAPLQWTYGYDAAGRLIFATASQSQTNWTYDGNGNRLSENNVQSTFDAQDRVMTSGSFTFDWDALGGLKSRSIGGLTTKLSHDGLGALQAATLPDNSTVEFTYDALQRRIAKRRNGTTEKQWIYDGRYRVVAERNATTMTTSRFVYAQGEPSPDAVLRGDATFALIKNHLGSVRLAIDSATGTRRQRIDYDAWGNLISDAAPTEQPFAFAGGVFDRDLQLTHFGFRDYDPSLGRWTSKDPIRLAGGLNTYAYANASPATRTDTTGLFIEYDEQTIDRYSALNFDLYLAEISMSGGEAAAGLKRLRRDRRSGIKLVKNPDDATANGGGTTDPPVMLADGRRSCLVKVSPGGHYLSMLKKGVDAQTYADKPAALVAHEFGHAYGKLFGGPDSQRAVDWERELRPNQWSRPDHHTPWPGAAD